MTDIVDELRDLATTLERFRSVDEVDEALEAAASEIECLRLSLSETEDNTLLSYLADIRQKSGVGVKPMLSELSDAIATAISEARATGRREGMEESAKIIDANCIMDTSSGKTLSPRQEGNRDGLHYAAAIRAAMEK